jgi:hypothetical protein
VDSVDERTQAQLAAIGEIHGLLERDGIDHWLFGGWAVDFHVGEVTRPHDDVDLAVWADDHSRIADLLCASGWAHAPQADEDGGTGYERRSVRVELTFLVRYEDDSIRISLRAGAFPFAGGAFGGELLTLDGQSCLILERDSLVGMKSSARDDPEDQAKDASDLSALT